MKNILAKIAGIITIFAMTFSPVLANQNQNQQVTFCHVPPGNDGNPQTITTSYNAWQNGHSNHELDYMGPCQGDDDGDDEGDDEEDNTCEETSYVSDGGIDELQVDGHDAVDVAVIHDAWDASIPGATWVWSESAVVDATATTTKTFTLSFDIDGTPTDTTLWVAADNTYKVSVNDSTDLFVDANEDNFTAVDSYVIPAAELNSGANTIVFEVTNIAVADSTWEGNPAGLMYKLTVNCSDDEDGDDEEECDTEEGDCDEEETDQPGACDEMWAKFDITNFYNDVHGGNVTSDVYVGSNSNDVADGEWFQLHNGTNYIIDPVIEGYEDVPGLAVQRLNGKIRVVLHGSYPPVSIYDPLYKEYISGSIELFNANPTAVYADTSGNNKLEDGTGGSVQDIIGFSGDKVNFTVQVDNRGDDGFYADYVFAQEDDCDGEPLVCTSNANLLVNGGFEAPDVSTGNWAVYPSGTPNLGWSVAWKQPAGAPATANLEIHDNLWTPVIEGAQYAELDTDFGNPAGGAASVKISQTIPTVVGQSYVLSYDFSARPGTGLAQNVLGVWINGVQVATKTADGSANSGNAWTHYSFPFMATSTSTVIAFDDQGTPSDSLGTLLDNVSVNCTGGGEPQVCTQGAPLYARVKIDTTDATKWRNWGGGNLNAATPFFVGGNNPLQHGSGGNVYMGNEWFPLTNADGSFINDADIAGYSNVPGVAIQRMNGAIRVVNYGYLTGAGKELAAGSIELSTNASARLLGAWDKPNGFVDPISSDAYTGTRIHDATVNDALNPMDSRGSFVGYINQYDPRFDNVRVNSDLFQFHLVTTSGTDGFYARYSYDDMIEVPCVQNPQ